MVRIGGAIESIGARRGEGLDGDAGGRRGRVVAADKSWRELIEMGASYRFFLRCRQRGQPQAN